MSVVSARVPAAWLPALLLLAACAPERAQEVLGTVERPRLELVAQSDERIVEVPVREGDRVAVGAVLVVQEAGLAQPRIEQAKASLAEAERRLADLLQGARAREIEEARASLAGAQGTLDADAAEFRRMRELVERKLASTSELDRARARRDASLASRDAARAKLELLREGTRPEQVAEARAAVARATAAFDEVREVAERHTVRAPRAGLVEALPYELGERPPAGRPVAILLADEPPYARVYVPQPLRTRFAPGAKVGVRVDGEERVFAGTVRFLSADAAFTPYYALTQKDRSRLAYLAEIVLDEPEAARLPTGLPAQVAVPAAP